MSDAARSAAAAEFAIETFAKTRARFATIVYVTLQRTAEEIANFLERNGLSARAYHAGMNSDVRNEVQEWWMAGSDRIVVATIAFGMGIDKADVRYVYHFNLPKGLESYAQEIGRAGRDGAPSTVELLACRDDVPALENFVYGDTPPRQALQTLVQTVLASDNEFNFKETDWSSQFDLRPLVLKTALTYLELDGVVRQGTPFYAGYEMQPKVAPEKIYAAFGDKAGEFLRRLFQTAKVGRTWWKNRTRNCHASTCLQARETSCARWACWKSAIWRLCAPPMCVSATTCCSATPMPKVWSMA